MDSYGSEGHPVEDNEIYYIYKNSLLNNEILLILTESSDDPVGLNRN